MASQYKPLHATEFEVDSPHVKYTADTIESTYAYTSTVCTQNEATGKLVRGSMTERSPHASSSALPSLAAAARALAHFAPSLAAA